MPSEIEYSALENVLGSQSVVQAVLTAMLNRATPPERWRSLSLKTKAFCLTLGETTASLGVRSGSELLSDMFLPTKNFSASSYGFIVSRYIGTLVLVGGNWASALNVAMNSFNVISFSSSFSFRSSSDICWARATASLTLVVIPGKGRSKTNFGGPYGLDYAKRKRITRKSRGRAKTPALGLLRLDASWLGPMRR